MRGVTLVGRVGSYSCRGNSAHLISMEWSVCWPVERAEFVDGNAMAVDVGGDLSLYCWSWANDIEMKIKGNGLLDLDLEKVRQ